MEIRIVLQRFLNSHFIFFQSSDVDFWSSVVLFFFCICHEQVTCPSAPRVQGKSKENTFENFWVKLMKPVLVFCENWMMKDLCPEGYYWTTEWSVVSAFVLSFSICSKILNTFSHPIVNNNNFPPPLSSIVHLILAGLTESMSLLYVISYEARGSGWNKLSFTLLTALSAIPFVSDRCGVDLSRFHDKSAQAFLNSTELSV